MPKDHPCKIIWLSSVTYEPLKHWGGMLETCAAALRRHSVSSFRNDYSRILQIPPLTFRLQFSMWLLPPPEDENGFHASQNVTLFIGDRTPENRVCGTGRWYIHATAGFQMETSNYFSRLCLYTPRFSQGQVSFRVNVQSIRFLLSASKNWRSDFDMNPGVDRWGCWSRRSSNMTLVDNRVRIYVACPLTVTWTMPHKLIALMGGWCSTL